MDKSNIFIFSHLSDNFAQPATDDNSLIDLLENELGKKRIINKWVTPEMQWYVENGTQICDFPFLLGNIPVCSERAHSVLVSIIPEEFIEYLPIDIETRRYYVINVLSNQENLLDINRSNIQYFSTGRIMYIPNYVLTQKTPSAPIFRIVEFPTTIFITEPVLIAIQVAELTGGVFMECRIAKYNIFNKLFKF